MKKILFISLSALIFLSCSDDECDNSTAPVLTTTNASNITSNSISTGGVITSDGGANITAKGVVWSTTQNPTITLNTKTIDGTGMGTFVSLISGLLPNTTYYVRAYATNSVSTSYGNEITFTTTPDITTGLIAYYPFNGNANDESGNGNNGTVNGATLTSDRNGSLNSAYSFSGNSSNYINVTNNFSSFNSGISISVWLLDNNTLNDGRVLAIGNTDGSNTGFEIMKNANNGLGIRFRSVQGGLSTTPNLLNIFQTNNWIHYVVSFNFIDLTFKIYLNDQLELEGSLQSPSSNWSPFIVNSKVFNIARKTISNFDSWNGKIDDVRIYNRALTQSEVSYLYNN